MANAATMEDADEVSEIICDSIAIHLPAFSAQLLIPDLRKHNPLAGHAHSDAQRAVQRIGTFIDDDGFALIGMEDVVVTFMPQLGSHMVCGGLREDII